MKKRLGVYAAIIAAALLLVIVIVWLSLDKTDTVGICYRDSASGENAFYRQQVVQALTERGFEVVSVDAHGDQAKQIQQIAELAKKKCDVLLVEPVMRDAAEELLQAISHTDLPAVLFNRQIDTALLKEYPQIAYIGSDEKQPGQLQAQIMGGLPAGGDLNGDGTVSYLLIQGPEEYHSTAINTDSFEKALSSQQVHQLAKESGEWTVEDGRRICKQQLAAYGKDIEVVVCGDGQMAIGAAQAIEDGGRTVGKDVYLLSMGGEEAVLQMVSEGKISGTVYFDTAVQIQNAADTVLAKFRGESTDSVKILPYTVLVKEE